MITEGKRKYRWLKLLLIYAVVIIVCVLLTVLTKSKIYAAVFYPMIIAGLVIYIRREGCEWRSWFKKPRRDGTKRIIISASIILMLTAFTVALRTAVWMEGITETFEFNIYTCIASCLFAPLTEEILCRGIIVDILKERHGSAFVIIVSSVIFYIIHANPMNVGALLFGVLASWMVLKARSILPGIIMHYIWNNTIYFLPLIAENMANV